MLATSPHRRGIGTAEWRECKLGPGVGLKRAEAEVEMHRGSGWAGLLPDAAGVFWIHRLTLVAAKCLAELVEVLDRTVDAPAAG